MRKFRRIGRVVFFPLVIFSVLCAFAAEPKKPVVDTRFDPGTEAKMNALAAASTADAFQKLVDPEYVVNEKKMNKAVFRAFNSRKGEAIERALENLKNPVLSRAGGQFINRSKEMYVAKKILEVFPEEAGSKLVSLYRHGDTVARTNIIKVSANISGKAVGDLLIAALDDTGPSGDEYQELAGEPMRICDNAYNQLVLRYQVQGVMRTIGPVHNFETRDFQIAALRQALEK